jgi:hypothetical protein
LIKATLYRTKFFAEKGLQKFAELVRIGGAAHDDTQRRHAMVMPKRGYLFAALVVLAAIAALKLWADDSWLGRGKAHSDTPAASAQKPAEAAASSAATDQQPVSSKTIPEAQDQPQADDQSLIAGVFKDDQNSPDVFQGDPEDGPHAVYPEMAYEGGTVEAGTDLTHTFLVKNTGKADLLIHQVKPG